MLLMKVFFSYPGHRTTKSDIVGTTRPGQFLEEVKRLCVICVLLNVESFVLKI